MRAGLGLCPCVDDARPANIAGGSSLQSQPPFDKLMLMLAEEHNRQLEVQRREIIDLRRELAELRNGDSLNDQPPIISEAACAQDPVSEHGDVKQVTADLQLEANHSQQSGEPGDCSSTKEVPASSASKQAMTTKQLGKLLRSASSAHSCVRTRSFSIFFNSIIVLNCVAMGLEAHAECDPGFGGVRLLTILLVAEHGFTALFTLELLMNVIVNGTHRFCPTSADNRWNFLDAFLVAVGILSTWLIPLLSLVFGFEAAGSALRPLTVLRAVRIFRLARVVRTSPVFRDAWRLIRGLGDSASTLFWTFVVIFFFTYIFAIFGAAIIVVPLQEKLEEARTAGTNQMEIDDLADLCEVYGGIELLMYRLIQALLLDSIHAEMDRIQLYVWYQWAYFYAYFGFAVIVLMNLVTAIIVDNAMQCTQQDLDHDMSEKDKARQQELADLEALFLMIDVDGSGSLTWEEFKSSFSRADVQKKWRLLDIHVEECKELFELLDTDGGEIDTAEFFDGLMRMRGPATSKDILRIEKKVQKHFMQQTSERSKSRQHLCTV